MYLHSEPTEALADVHHRRLAKHYHSRLICCAQAHEQVALPFRFSVIYERGELASVDKGISDKSRHLLNHRQFRVKYYTQTCYVRQNGRLIGKVYLGVLFVPNKNNKLCLIGIEFKPL